jgi:hypothetical protein
MKRFFLASLAILFSSAAAFAADDPASIKAQADAQNARLGVAKAQIDLLNSIKGSMPNNPSAIATGDKTAEAQILKYATYRAAAAKLIKEIGGTSWKKNAVTPLVVIGSSPPSFALLSAFRSDSETVRTALNTALVQWHIASTMSPTLPLGPDGKPRTDTNPALFFAALGDIATVLAPSSTIAGAALTADNAQVITAVEEAVAVHGHADFSEFHLSKGGKDEADKLLGDLPALADKARSEYASEYVPAVNQKTYDAKDAAIKAAGTSLASAVAAYDALHAKLVSDSNGVETNVAIRRLIDLEGTAYATRPLLYILGNEASLTVETKKGVLHWFNGHPFDLRAVVTLNYVYINGPSKTAGRRGFVTCVVTASRYADIPQAAKATVTADTCGDDLTD